MMVNGREIKEMDLDNKLGQMVLDMKVNGELTELMAKVNFGT